MLHQLLVISSENSDLRSITSTALGSYRVNQPTWTVQELDDGVEPRRCRFRCADSREIKPGCGDFFDFLFSENERLENLTEQYRSLLSEGTACSRHIFFWYLVLVGPTQLCKTYYQDVRIWTTLWGNGTGTFVKVTLALTLTFSDAFSSNSWQVPLLLSQARVRRFYVSHEWAKVGNISMLIQRLWEETWQNHEQDHHRDP